LVQVFGDHGEFVRRAEQERAVDAEDGRVVGDVFILKNVNAAVFNVVVGDLRDGGGRSDTADKQQSGQNHAGFHGDSEIGENGKGEGDQPDANVGFSELEQLRNLTPLTHVVGHDHQNSGQRCHRHITQQ